MKHSVKKVHSIGDFQLRFTPVSLTFQRSPTKPLKIYLQKNVQIIGQVYEQVHLSHKTLKYSFSSAFQPIEFRLFSNKHTVYQLSIYEIALDGSEQWKAEAQINLAKFLTQYEQEFKKQEENLQLELREKEASLPQIWKELAKNFSQREWQSTAKFKSIDAMLQFTIHPYHEYDEMLRIYEIEKEKQEKERKARAMFRSNTQPNLIRNFTMPNIQKNSAQEGTSISAKLTMSATLSLQKQAAKQQLQKFSNQLQFKAKQQHLSNIQEQEQSILANTSKAEGHKTDGMVTSVLQLEIDNQLQEQEFRQIKKALNQDEAIKPYLALQDVERSRKIAENVAISAGQSISQMKPDNSQPSRLGIISLGSGSDKHNVVVSQGSGTQSKFKQYALTALATVVLGFLVVFLMNPISKVH